MNDMNHAVRRQPRGSRQGGQFATSARPESQVSLTNPHKAANDATRQAVAELAALRQNAESERVELNSRLAELDQVIDILDVRIATLDASLEAGESWEEASNQYAEDNGWERFPNEYGGPTAVDTEVITNQSDRFTLATEPKWDFYRIRVQVDRELTEEDEQTLAGLVGYAWRATSGGGEPVDIAYKDAPNSLVLDIDSSKARRDSYGHNFYHSLTGGAGLKGFSIQEGSPVRQKDGQRLVSGLGDVKLHLYYD